MKTEYRSINEKPISNGRHIEGYACVFNTPSTDPNLGFTEIILPSAITDDTIKKSDVFALLNHDEDKILARSKYGIGNLSLAVDDYGLKYEFDALNNELGDTIVEYLKSGIIDSSSFGFAIYPNTDKWEKKDGTLYRYIQEIAKLTDVSPVFNAAYPNTSVSCRKEQEYDDLDNIIDLLS